MARSSEASVIESKNESKVIFNSISVYKNHMILMICLCFLDLWVISHW